MSRSVRSVTVIPASINPNSHLPIALQRKRRVAGYARVSTDSEEQQTSYEAQVDYYTRFIQSKPECSTHHQFCPFPSPSTTCRASYSPFGNVYAPYVFSGKWILAI